MSSVPLISLPSQNKRQNDGQVLGSDKDDEDPLEGVFSHLRYRAENVQSDWIFRLIIAGVSLLLGFLISYMLTSDPIEVILKKTEISRHDVENGVRFESIIEFMRQLTNESNSTGSNKSLREAQILENHLKSNDFDLISPLVQSVIHLSYPDPELPNKVEILGEKNRVLLSCNDSRPKISDSSKKGDVTKTSITVQGNILYVNFGRNEDYHYLDSLSIGISGHIVLARAGRTLPIDMVNNALDHEAKGILIYLDPQQKDVVEPLLSLVDLAKLQDTHGKYDGNAKESVPVLIITAADAEKILKEMSADDPSPDSWRGDLESSYPIGPGFSDPSWGMIMNVNTVNVVKNYYDVVGAIRGSQEPDRFVMLANERDPWSSNGDEQRSTAMIMEIVRVLGNLKKTAGWSPHRSIVIASWGLGGPEQRFSSNPEMWSQFELKTVSYLKVDSTYLGNETVSSRGTLILDKIFRDVSKAADFKAPPLDVMLQLGNNDALVQHGVPFLELLQNKKYVNETMEKITSLWGVLAWNLADSHALPFSLSSYIHFFNHSMTVVEEKFKSIALRHTLFLDKLKESVERLITTIRSFQERWSHADKSKSIEMRIMNDQLLRFVHSFVCHNEQLSLKHKFRHMIFSQSTKENDPTAGFGVLQDLLREITSAHHSDDLQQLMLTHLSSLVECINSVRHTLNDGLEAFIFGET